MRPAELILESWSNGGLAGHAVSEEAVDLVVVTLSRIARSGHGDTALIRSLTRPERAPTKGISAF